MSKDFTMLAVRLYAGQDDDLLEWFRGLDDLPPGTKAHEIRKVLRAGITPQAPEHPEITLAAIGAEVERRLAALLKTYAIQTAAPDQAAPDEGDATWFDEFGSGFLIDAGSEPIDTDQ